MKLKRFVFVASSMLVFALGCTWMLAQAHPGQGSDHQRFGHGRPPLQHGMQMQRGFAELNLSETQLQQLREVMHGGSQVREESKILQESLHQLIVSDNFNVAEAQDITGQIGNLTAKIELERAERMNQFYHTLDQQQKDKLTELSQHRPHGPAR